MMETLSSSPGQPSLDCTQISTKFPILIHSVMRAMKIQRDDVVRSFCKLWEFDLRFSWLIVFFVVSLLSSYAVAQTGPAPTASIPQLGPTINKNMAIVLMVLLCFFFVLGFFSVYTRRCSQERTLIGEYDFAVIHDHNNNHSRRMARGLDAAILETFPTFAYSAVKEFKMGKTSLDCAVCLNAFEGDDLLRLLPKCSHVFHFECIDAWLATHSTCPVCRANLLPKPGEINQTWPPLLDNEIRLNESNRGSESNQLERQVSIHIAEEPEDRDDQALAPNSKENRQSSTIDLSRMMPRSRSSRWATGGVSQWYNSTGRTLENDETFTLRLPEDVRNQILNSVVGRSRSCLTLPRERSRREGYREESEEVGRARSWRREYPSAIGGRVGGVPFAPANVSQV